MLISKEPNLIKTKPLLALLLSQESTIYARELRGKKSHRTDLLGFDALTLHPEGRDNKTALLRSILESNALSKSNLECQAEQTAKEVCSESI